MAHTSLAPVVPPASADTAAEPSVVRSAVNAVSHVLGVAAVMAAFEQLKDAFPFHSDSSQDDSDVVPVSSGPGFFARGQFLSVRPLTADDSVLLDEFLSTGLSDESRRMRFLVEQPHVSAAAVDYLAARDGRDRVALVALTPDSSAIVGMVEYALAPNAGPESLPEVALAVADAWQGAGVGKMLVKMLATLSIAGGYPVWEASMLDGNAGSRATLECVGHVTAAGRDADVVTVHVALDPDRIAVS